MTSDEIYCQVIKSKLEELELPKPAIDWLIMIWDITQFFDDIADGDLVSRDTLDRVIWNSLVSMHINSFFSSNAQTLIPCMANCILKWQASDAAEKEKTPSAMSFAWRASFYDLVLIVLHICHGAEFAVKNAKRVMNLHGEKYDDYLKEFNHG